MHVKSRYTDRPEVIIDISAIPEALRSLTPLAKKWCIVDVEERDECIESAAVEDLLELVVAFNPVFPIIEEWSENLINVVPQPDELVMFEIAADAANIAIFTDGVAEKLLKLRDS